MNSITINTEKDQTERTLNIRLEGELTLSNAYDIKQCFLSALDEFENLNVTIKNVENIDLSFIQLLCSLQKSAAKLSKNIDVNMTLPEEMAHILKNSGFERLLTNKDISV